MGAARLTFAAILPAALVAGCGEPPPSLVLAATTSTYDSGLLEHLVSRFESVRPEARVRTIVVGSGEALELGRRGDADVLLVHAPAAEDRFLRDGHATERVPVMYNGFVIVGPPEDPAGIAGLADPRVALARIRERSAAFVSRGDSSGTHERELALWREAGIELRGEGYVEAGEGQAITLQIADERRAYTLTDRATFAVFERLVDLVPLAEGHSSLVNLYSVIVPVRSGHPGEAATFADWLTSAAGRMAIAEFRRDASGTPLFSPLLVGQELPIPGLLHDEDTPQDTSAQGLPPPPP